LVKVGVDELDDTPAAVWTALTEVFGLAVAEAEDAAIAAGTGTAQPRGITLAANIARIPSGQKTAAGASNTPTLADLQGLPWKLPDRYRARASWLIHPTAASKIAAITYTNGSPWWPEPGNPTRKLAAGSWDGRATSCWVCPIRASPARPTPRSCSATGRRRIG
jgi:HK97 family phage major capsid protein